MDQHVNFTEAESTMELGNELVPVFVQDADDYPSDGLYHLRGCDPDGVPIDEDGYENCEVDLED